jgi:hypothetical protein
MNPLLLGRRLWLRAARRGQGFSPGFAPLPFYFDTPVRAYLFDAYPGGILWHRPGFIAELCAGSLNLIFPFAKFSDGRLHKVRSDPYMGWSDWERRGFVTLKSFFAELKDGDERAFVACLSQHLEQGHYLLLHPDEYHIPGQVRFGFLHKAHPILVIGYDPGSNCFACAGYHTTGEFCQYPISASDLRNGLRSSAPGVGAVAIAVHENRPPRRIDSEAICSQIDDYLSARFSSRSWAGSDQMITPAAYGAFGVAAYPHISRYLVSGLSRRRSLDLRPTRVLWERQLLMKFRLELCIGHKAAWRPLEQIRLRSEQAAHRLHWMLTAHARGIASTPEAVKALIDIVAESERSVMAGLRDAIGVPFMGISPPAIGLTSVAQTR